MSFHAADRSGREWIVVALLVVAAAVLLFARLDDRLLWQDEAETALLAESVLREGWPTAFDGRNLISQEGQQEFSPPDYRWYWTPWLQHYVTAASFALSGPSTFSARMPFVLFGLGTLVLCAAVARRLCRDRWAPAYAVLLLASSVPFLLHVRQCRYYALASFFGLLLVHEYLRLLEGRRLASLGLVVAATGLFHSHYVLLAGFSLGLGVHLVLGADLRAALPRIAACAAATTVLALPFLVGFAGHSSVQALPGLARSLANLAEAAHHLNRYVIPFVLAPLALAGLLLARRHRAVDGEEKPACSEASDEDESRSAIVLLSGILLSALLLLTALMPWFFFRYYVALIPVCALLQTLLVVHAMRRATIPGLVLLACLAFTDLPARLLPLPSAAPEDRVRSLRTGDETSGEVVGRWARFLPLAAYLYEVTRERTGPLEAVVAHLRTHARPGDKILVTYGDLPIQFYTDLKVVGGLSLEDPTPHVDADWLLVRTHTHRRGDARLKRFIGQRFEREDFRVEHLAPLDTPYENRPDPVYHKFRDPTEGLPAVKLWRRIDPVVTPAREEAA